MTEPSHRRMADFGLRHLRLSGARWAKYLRRHHPELFSDTSSASTQPWLFHGLIRRTCAHRLDMNCSCTGSGEPDVSYSRFPLEDWCAEGESLPH